jgi:outer membrane lipoprotein-sorting protein
MRLVILFLAVLLAYAPQPTLAQPRSAVVTARDQADVARIEAYLDGLRSLNARFLQTAPDGQTSEGQAWLERPGRMRFQYDPPSPLLLVASRGMVIFHDAQLEQTSQIPAGSTPLGLLLSDQLHLSGDVTVTGIERLPGQIQLTLVRTAKPEEGSLTLIFVDRPLTLRGWIVLDAQHQETHVSLFKLQAGGNFDPKLFIYNDPKFYNDNAPPTPAFP